MKTSLSEKQKLFLQHANEANMVTRMGASFELGRYKVFTYNTVKSLAKRGLVTVGGHRYDNTGRCGVYEVWVTAAGREALHNA